jgi:hypothetical protein
LTGTWRAAVAVAILAGLLALAAVQAPHRALSSPASECTGEYRWDIKTLSDDQANEVDLKAVNAGVADFWEDKKPPGFKSSIRNPPLEKTVYRVKANLREARWVNDAPTATKKGGDLDIHLVIEALTNPNKTMVVEFPFKDCVHATPLLKKLFVAARNAFMTKCKGGTLRTQFHDLSGTATITGVGFYDKPHASGASQYGVELHPVLRFSSTDCQWLN